MINSIDNLLRLNVLDSDDIKEVTNYTVRATRPDLILKDGSIRRQVSTFSALEEAHRYRWQHKDFDYKISELGFRDIDLINHINLAAFGCSYTFGTGLPEDTLWHKLLAKSKGYSTYNFGLPGASIKTISDVFCIVANNIKIDKAVVLFPTYMRTTIAAENMSNQSVRLIGLLPQYKPPVLENYNINHDMFYKYIPDVEFIRKMKEDIYIMEHMAKKNDIQLYISSWDLPTYELLKTLKKNHMVLLEQWTTPENIQDDWARDIMHPGMAHHAHWVDKIEQQVYQ